MTTAQRTMPWKVFCDGGPTCREKLFSTNIGYVIHIGHRFCDVFVPDEAIDRALKHAERRITPQNRERWRRHTAENITIGVSSGSYKEWE